MGIWCSDATQLPGWILGQGGPPRCSSDTPAEDGRATLDLGELTDTGATEQQPQEVATKRLPWGGPTQAFDAVQVCGNATGNEPPALHP